MGRSKEKKYHVGALSHSHEDNPLVVEVRAQSKALGQLSVYRRLAYSGMALGALLIYGSFNSHEGNILLVIGISLMVVSLPLAAILHVGISHGKANVQKMIDILEQGTSGKDKKPKSTSEFIGDTPSES